MAGKGKRRKIIVFYVNERCIRDGTEIIQSVVTSERTP